MWSLLSEKLEIGELSGRYESTDADRIENFFQQLADNSYVVVDLKRLEAMVSRSWSAFVAGLKQSQQRGIKIYLCGAKSTFTYSFTELRKDLSFEVCENYTQALKQILSHVETVKQAAAPVTIEKVKQVVSQANTWTHASQLVAC